METFATLFGGLLAFVYHCFDRIVMLGHIPLLTRPEIHPEAASSSATDRADFLIFPADQQPITPGQQCHLFEPKCINGTELRRGNPGLGESGVRAPLGLRPHCIQQRGHGGLY